MKRPLTLGGLVVLLLACGAPPAAAISRSSADRAALRALAPAKKQGAVVVFALGRKLRASDVLSEPSPKPARGRALGHGGWLYWMDLEYRSDFAHPSVVVLIDDRNGRPVLRRKLRFWPRINGRDLPFSKGRAYGRRTGAIFQRLVPKKAFSLKSFTQKAKAAQDAPKGLFEGDCFYGLGGASSSSPRSLLNIAAYWRSLGVETNFAPLPNEPGRKHYDLVDVERGLIELTTRCKDIIWYIAGHGNSSDVLLADKGDNGRAEDLWISPDFVANMIVGHASTEFKLIVDACASGDYVKEVRRLVELRGGTNLLIEVSGGTGSQATFDYYDRGGDQRKVLTEGLIAGMQKAEAEVFEDGSGVPAAARLIQLGLRHRTLSFIEAGLNIHPTVHHNLKPWFKRGPEQAPGETQPPAPGTATPQGSGRIVRDCQPDYDGCTALRGFITFNQPFGNFRVLMPENWQGAGSEARVGDKPVGTCHFATTRTYSDTIECVISQQPAGAEVQFQWQGIHNGLYERWPDGQTADLYHLNPASGPFAISGP
jgi:hypothetical protein